MDEHNGLALALVKIGNLDVAVFETGHGRLLTVSRRGSK
jgi:hypothetical protein